MFSSAAGLRAVIPAAARATIKIVNAVYKCEVLSVFVVITVKPRYVCESTRIRKIDIAIFDALVAVLLFSAAPTNKIANATPAKPREMCTDEYASPIKPRIICNIKPKRTTTPSTGTIFTGLNWRSLKKNFTVPEQLRPYDRQP